MGNMWGLSCCVYMNYHNNMTLADMARQAGDDLMAARGKALERAGLTFSALIKLLKSELKAKETKFIKVKKDAITELPA